MFIYLFHSNELKDHQKLCLEHEPCILKLLKESSFRSSKTYYRKPLNFLGNADFETMNKEDDTERKTRKKNNYEQVPSDVSFYMTNKLGNPPYFDSSDRKCLRGL